MTDDTNNKSLSIGQVIYVLSNKAQKIVPAIVVEEVMVKKLDGNHVSWKVSVGPAGKEKVIDSNRLDGDIYVSLDDIREVLHKRLATFLDDLVDEAEKRVETWYGKQTTKIVNSVSSTEDPNEKIDPEGLMASIENGTQMPEAGSVRQQLFVPKSPSQVQMELRRHMENIADPSIQFPKKNHPTSEPDTIGTEEILLPGGQRIKVNIKGS